MSLVLVLGACRNEAAKAPDVAAPAAEAEPGTPITNDPAVAAQATAGGTTSTGLPPASTTDAPSAAPPPPADPSLRERAPLRDDQIAAVASAVNDAEIEQAKVARTRSKNASVKKLAETIATDHQQAKQALAKLHTKLAAKPAPGTTPTESSSASSTERVAKPMESTLSTELSADATSTLNTLKKAPAASFDGTFLESHVASHRKLVDALDRELIPDAKDVDLKTYLQDLRRRAQSHLDEALAIQKTLAASAPASPSK